MTDYIDFSISSWCLPKLMLALNNDNIYEYTITEEDNNLHICIRRDVVERAAYPSAFKPKENLTEDKEK